MPNIWIINFELTYYCLYSVNIFAWLRSFIVVQREKEKSWFYHPQILIYCFQNYQHLWLMIFLIFQKFTLHMVFTFVTVRCSPGEFLNITAGICEHCPSNFYQNLTGQITCKPCPPATGTESSGSISESQCQG